MKKILLIAFLFPLFAFDGSEKFLNNIAPYQQDSYFKEKVYAEHDRQSFYAMKEPNQVINPESYDLHLLNAAVFYATNKLRKEKGLKELQFSPQLRNAAVIHSSQMIEKNFFDHFNPRTRALHSPDDRMKLCSVQSTAYGENVDLNNITMPSHNTYLQVAETIVKDFLNSPPHKKIMLDKNFTRLGCSAMFEGKDKNGARYYKATQDYAAN